MQHISASCRQLGRANVQLLQKAGAEDVVSEGTLSEKDVTAVRLAQDNHHLQPCLSIWPAAVGLSECCFDTAL